jgi:ribosomal protein L37AE/L43A
MAMSLIFICEQCGFSVEGWDDGNPYILNSKGKRVYFYHPGGEAVLGKVVGEILGPIYTDEARDEVLATRTGNASDHICLKCAKTFKLDPDRDEMECPKCHHMEVVEVYLIAGKPCPKCQSTMPEGQVGAIS